MGKAVKGWPSRVQALITKHGSAEALALACNVSYHTIQRWAKGTHTPQRIAQRLLATLERDKVKHA